ncbi:putative serpin family protein [Blattamonas nauphoetae]|uniref:Serpin family protein n=1 Tax=Blattamonas nauphoetae TaxID=2049346 RepID=A0ABQ9X6H3_9EUKA|nr:putative serpin family protein [Blattamonas nauphoetae]
MATLLKTIPPGPALITTQLTPETELKTKQIHSHSISAFGHQLLLSLGWIDKNVFISPLSIHECLLMAANGSAEETLRGITSALQFPDGETDPQFHSHFNLMGTADRKTKRTPPFTMVNSLWISKNVQVYETYLQECRSLFGAEAQQLDFDSSSSVATINRYVNDHTHGLIKTAVQTLPRNCRMLLINTIHFKSHFTKIFPVNATHDDDFTTLNGMKKKVKMMHLTDSLAYLSTHGASLVNLGFRHADIRMILILPKTSDQEALQETINQCFCPTG